RQRGRWEDEEASGSGRRAGAVDGLAVALLGILDQRKASRSSLLRHAYGGPITGVEHFLAGAALLSLQEPDDGLQLGPRAHAAVLLRRRLLGGCRGLGRGLLGRGSLRGGFFGTR